MKKTILQLLFLFCLSLPLTFGQTTDGGSFWNKLGIGAGYNFLNNSGFPDDREKLLTSVYLSCRWSIDLRTNIRFTWWFLSMWIAAVKNGNTIRPTISFPVCIASGERNLDIIIPYLIGKASTYSGVWVLAIYIQKEILNILQSGMEINGLTIFSEEKV